MSSTATRTAGSSRNGWWRRLELRSATRLDHCEVDDFEPLKSFSAFATQSRWAASPVRFLQACWWRWPPGV